MQSQARIIVDSHSVCSAVLGFPTSIGTRASNTATAADPDPSSVPPTPACEPGRSHWSSNYFWLCHSKCSHIVRNSATYVLQHAQSFNRTICCGSTCCDCKRSYKMFCRSCMLQGKLIQPIHRIKDPSTGSKVSGCGNPSGTTSAATPSYRCACCKFAIP